MLSFRFPGVQDARKLALKVLTLAQQVHSSNLKRFDESGCCGIVERKLVQFCHDGS